jgi:cytochrome oxidase Cu insertion factor (SCO1/SenC/PrrC family)
MRKKAFALLSMAILFAVSGCKSADHRAFDAGVLNKPAPDFELDALDGGSVRLSKMKGKPVVLAFFAHG